MRASDIQSDLFRGLRLWVEPSGRLRLEGTVRDAARFTGLAQRTIHHCIEDGQIESRQPGAHRSDADRKDAIGRKRRFKRLVNMRDVFKLAYGEREAMRMMEKLGL
ncbi:MAG TPA: hypothetical protein PLA50_00390 [Bacteroidia bacterium]|nr:hypothetical protein [Bacteroidia bacterium]